MISVKRLWMDYEDRLMGTEEMPLFGWVMESAQRNVYQTAYRLQLARDAGFARPVYDSGRVESGASAHIAVHGVPLLACVYYYARVRVWTEAEASEWSAPAVFLTGMVNRPWQARFISAETAADWGNSKGTYLRREIRLREAPAFAALCATALGVYQLRINGQAVSGDQLAPGWTNYHRHLCYQTYDVTGLMRPGANVLGAHLGAGWYKGTMGFILERNNYGDRTALLAELTVRYADGTEERFATDSQWLGCDSPVTFAEIYDGEIYDARLEQPGWDAPGFTPVLGAPKPAGTPRPARDAQRPARTDEEKAALRAAAQAYRPADSRWRPVALADGPMDALTPQAAGRTAITQELPVRQILRTPKGETVLDYGQNMTGWVRFRVRGAAGALAHLRCFETLDAQGNAYFDNLRTAKAEIRYLCRGGGTETYMEHFSFQGFRYAKLEQWPCEARPEDFTACAVHSQMRETGRFSCSHPLVNQLEHNIEWSLRGNFLDIPTDCPQRDERMGWTGDAQIFCRTACYLRGAYMFFRKWLKDVAIEQTPEGGVPHIVPNTLQYHRITDWLLGQGTHSAAAWADVAVILPWTLYLTYGDQRILREQFDSMRRWIDFMQAHAVDDIWNYKLQFGDWVALDAQEGSYFGATPNDLTCTAYYAYSTGLFVKACRALGEDALAESYGRVYQRVVKKFRETFLDAQGVMQVQTQTAHIVALYFGLIPPEGIAGTVQGLKRLLAATDGHLVTGFVGTPYFCHALSQNGCKEEAYALLLKEDFPSWLYQVKKGATTIWEHWDGLKPDGSMWSPDMNSFNHYAYGAIGEWLYRAAAGLEIDEAMPGYRRAVIAPLTGGGLTQVSGSFDSIYGEVSSAWKREGNRVTLTAGIPVNTDGIIRLEPGATQPQGDAPFAPDSRGQWTAHVGSGLWKVTYTLA